MCKQTPRRDKPYWYGTCGPAHKILNTSFTRFTFYSGFRFAVFAFRACCICALERGILLTAVNNFITVDYVLSVTRDYNDRVTVNTGHKVDAKSIKYWSARPCSEIIARQKRRSNHDAIGGYCVWQIYSFWTRLSVTFSKSASPKLTVSPTQALFSFPDFSWNAGRSKMTS